MIYCLAISVTSFALGLLVGGWTLRSKAPAPPDMRPPSLKGHRPGIMSTEVDDVTTFSAFCSCGWKGGEHASEAGARGEASNHAKGLL